MSAIERDDNEPMIDDEPIDDEPEPEPEPLPPPVKAVKADGRKKPRSAKQEAAFKAMTEKRKMMIAQKKAGHTAAKAADMSLATTTPTRTASAPAAAPLHAPTPAAHGTVNNYYYYSHDPDTPPPRAPKLKRSAPEPEYEDTSSDDEEIPTARQTIYFG
jgi:hypothetical protein